MGKSNGKIGEEFENYVRDRLSFRGWSVVRIPDGCKQISPFKIIRIKSPFDFMATRKGQAIFFDAKTTEGSSFPFSKINPKQVDKLLKIQQNGFVAGYLIYFRECGVYAFVDAHTLNNLSKGKSIKAKDCLNLGREINLDHLFHP